MRWTLTPRRKLASLLEIRRALDSDARREPALWTAQVERWEAFVAFLDTLGDRPQRWLGLERSLIPADDVRSFELGGTCAICGPGARFAVEIDPYAGDRLPNWREGLICTRCRLNARMRASLHFLRETIAAAVRPRLYVTEQVTPLFRAARRIAPAAVGSEFLDGAEPGRVNRAGVRHEDVTALSFADGGLDVILSLDVLEHVPAYPRALQEFARCLRAGGRLILTVPFDLGSKTTFVRARKEHDGSVTHFAPPEHHGDPVTGRGVLSFYVFGWDLLDAIRDAGFSDVAAHCYWSRELAYLGGLQVLLAATK